jgi:hypothetical protein
VNKSKVARNEKSGQEKWYVQADLIAGLDAPTTVKYLLERIRRHIDTRQSSPTFGFAWASQETLAWEMSASRSKMQRAWRWAVRRKFVLSRTVRTGKRPDEQHNEYRLDCERMKLFQRPSEHASPVTLDTKRTCVTRDPEHASPVVQ